MVTCCRNSSNSSSRCIFAIKCQKPQPNHLSITFPKIEDDPDHIWLKIQSEASCNSHLEPILSNYYQISILTHKTLESALAHQLARKLSHPDLLSDEILLSVFTVAFGEAGEIGEGIRADLRAAKDRDPACKSYLICFLNYKGFLAVESHRVAHWLWKQGRTALALLIQSRVSEVLGVDIHPAARVGSGVLLDHATGVVIGETAVVGDGVTIMHGVTLGGRGKAAAEDRHPNVENGVFVGAGACVLGNVRVGRGAKIGAGAVVLRDVPPAATAVGNPAKLIGGKGER